MKPVCDPQLTLEICSAQNENTAASKRHRAMEIMFVTWFEIDVEQFDIQIS